MKTLTSYSKCLRTETVSAREHFTAVGSLFREIFLPVSKFCSTNHKESHPNFLNNEENEQECYFKFPGKRMLCEVDYYFVALHIVSRSPSAIW